MQQTQLLLTQQQKKWDGKMQGHTSASRPVANGFAPAFRYSPPLIPQASGPWRITSLLSGIQRCGVAGHDGGGGEDRILGIWRILVLSWCPGPACVATDLPVCNTYVAIRLNPRPARDKHEKETEPTIAMWTDVSEELKQHSGQTSGSM
jgi:hypothetical protein